MTPLAILLVQKKIGQCIARQANIKLSMPTICNIRTTPTRLDCSRQSPTVAESRRRCHVTHVGVIWPLATPN